MHFCVAIADRVSLRSEVILNTLTQHTYAVVLCACIMDVVQPLVRSSNLQPGGRPVCRAQKPTSWQLSQCPAMQDHNQHVDACQHYGLVSAVCLLKASCGRQAPHQHALHLICLCAAVTFVIRPNSPSASYEPLDVVRHCSN